MAEGWSDRKKWWMDLVKACIVFSVVTGVSIAYLEVRARRKDFRDLVGRAWFESRMAEKRVFQVASHEYALAVLTWQTESAKAHEGRDGFPAVDVQFAKMSRATVLMMESFAGADARRLGEIIKRLQREGTNLFVTTVRFKMGGKPSSGELADELTQALSAFMAARADMLREYDECTILELGQMMLR